MTNAIPVEAPHTSTSSARIRLSGSASADLRDLSRRAAGDKPGAEASATGDTRASQLSRALLHHVLGPLIVVCIAIAVFELIGLNVSVPIAAVLGAASLGLAVALRLLRTRIADPRSRDKEVSEAAVVAAGLFAANAGIHWVAAPGSPGSHAFPVAVAFCVSLIPARRARTMTAIGLSIGCLLSWFVMIEPVSWFSLVSSFAVGLLLAVGVNKAASGVMETWMLEAADKLEEQRQHYDVLLSSIRDDQPKRILEARGEMDGLWEWNLKTDQIYFSPRWRALLGYGDHGQTAKADVWFNLVHPYDLDELMNRLASHLDGKTSYFECEHRIRQADGSYRWVLSHGRVILDSEGAPERLAGSQIDIKRMKNYEAQLVHEATHDRLTGLANRQQLLEQLGEEFIKSRGSRSYRFAVAFLDLDRFKYVNDTLGHMVGDELLKVVADRLKRAVRSNDLVSRLGGDEFVVLMRGVRDPEEALALGTRIRDAIATTIQIGQHQIGTAASVGVAVSHPDVTKADEILGWADIAMYEAKSKGKGRVQAFDAAMHDAASNQFLLQNELSKALERNQFELHYQPIVAAADGAIVGVEALIRWRKSDGELIMPGQFIPVAEETGLIVPIGKWVFRAACLQVKRWMAEGLEPVKISVNFAAKQLADPATTEFVRETLEETGVDPRLLQVEITESDLVDNRHSTPESLDRLKLLGVETAIDDFGTGYSSLSYLRKLNCSVLKIDQSFVRDLHVDQRAAALARSIIDMAHNLGLGVVAEGVETYEQLELLREFECDLIQGYLVCRAAPATDLRKLIAAGQVVISVPADPDGASNETPDGEAAAAEDAVAVEAGAAEDVAAVDAATEDVVVASKDAAGVVGDADVAADVETADVEAADGVKAEATAAEGAAQAEGGGGAPAAAKAVKSSAAANRKKPKPAANRSRSRRGRKRRSKAPAAT